MSETLIERATRLGLADVNMAQMLDRVEDLERQLAELRAQQTWKCFHCDEEFTDAEQAALHFGTTQMQQPVCQIDAAHVRELEAELARYREEDTDLHRQIHGLHAAHHTNLQREEEKGYARGIADARLLPTAQQVEDARDAARYRWLRENHAAKEHWYDEEGIEAVRLEFAAVGDTLEEAIESEMRNLCKQERRNSMETEAKSPIKSGWRGELNGFVEDTPGSHVPMSEVAIRLDKTTAWALCNILTDSAIESAACFTEDGQRKALANLGSAIGRLIDHPAANNGGRKLIK